MMETHTVEPVVIENILLRTKTYRWQCTQCTYCGVVVVNNEDHGGVFTILDDGDLLIRHRCKNHSDLKPTIENHNTCVWTDEN